MLSPEDFSLWCRQLSLSEQAQNLIVRIRTSPPARRVRSSVQNVSGHYPSRKMGVTIQFESHRNALAAIREMEHDPLVLEYYDQPCAVKLSFITKSGRATAIPNHIPDFFVLRKDGAGWEECQTEEELIRLTEKSPNRYFQEGGEWRCPPGERYAEQFGLDYCIRSSKHINWVEQRNLSFLEYYFRAGSVVAGDSHEAIDSILAAEPGISLENLLCRIEGKANSDDVNLLIATETIYVDLRAAPLAEPDRVQVFANEAAAVAYGQILRAAPQTAAIAPRSVSLAVGSKVEWDSKGWEIVNVGETKIGLIGEMDQFIEIPIATFEDLIKSGRVTGIKTDSLPNQHPEVMERFKSASKADLEKANQRHRLVLAYMRGDSLPDEKIPSRTLRRFVAEYRKAQTIYGCGYIGLLPRTRQRGNRNRKLPEDTYALMDEFIKDGYETLKQKGRRTVHSSLVLACEQRGVVPPSFRTFCVAIKKRPRYEQILRRQGRRAAYQHKTFYWELNQTTPRHGDRPFEICHIDHTKFDIELLCSSTGRPLGRPWATILTDAFSRRFLAVYLTFDPPSYRSCMMVIRECVRRHSRFPQTIVVDGGAEFSSTYFEALLALYECTKKTRPPAKGRFGSVCERLFGTTNTQFVHNLSGNTQITRNVRQVTKSVAPKSQAVWTIGSLYPRFCEFAYEVYDANDHPALGHSPQQAFTAGMLRGGQRPDRLIAYDQDFLILTMPSTRKGTAKVSPARGVKINNINYWCDAFRNPEIENTQVEVRYDPFDAGIAYAFVGNQWTRCISEHFTSLQGRSEKEIKLATEELRKRRKEHSVGSAITAKRLADFLQSTETEETLLRQRRLDMENKQVLEVIDGQLKSDYRINEASDKQRAAASESMVEAATAPASLSEEVEIYEEF